jgi:hypothetical protein
MVIWAQKYDSLRARQWMVAILTTKLNGHGSFLPGAD